MTRGPLRQVNHWTASRWLSLSMSAVAISLLAAGLLRALEETDERAEKLMVELTYRHMRTGLAVAKAEALLRGREAEIADWAGANPVRWLAAPPPGYRGECSRPAVELGAGEWCFDQERRELAYRPRRAAHLRIVAPPADGAAKILRWRTTDAGGQGSLHVEYVTAFEWVLE